jgi:hypothetical protein
MPQARISLKYECELSVLWLCHMNSHIGHRESPRIKWTDGATPILSKLLSFYFSHFSSIFPYFQIFVIFSNHLNCFMILFEFIEIVHVVKYT